MQVNNWTIIFREAIHDYHKNDDVDAAIENPYKETGISQLMYMKNWVDTVQWHLEDIIRHPAIDPVAALGIKRRIDISNQQRTDLVEYIDAWFLEQYEHIVPAHDAVYNTESPAWAIDRLSILELKIYHMNIEAHREDASEAHRNTCNDKLQVLLTQRHDLSSAIQHLLNDIEGGRKYMKVYKQMKMYNDESLNPVLYQKK